MNFPADSRPALIFRDALFDNTDLTVDSNHAFRQLTTPCVSMETDWPGVVHAYSQRDITGV